MSDRPRGAVPSRAAGLSGHLGMSVEDHHSLRRRLSDGDREEPRHDVQAAPRCSPSRGKIPYFC
jgi:hypothetical protein